NRAFHETDLRDVLPAVHVPTLLLYRSLPEEEAATMDVASRIPGARTMRVSGTDPGAIFLSPEIADEIDRFVAGEGAPAAPDSARTVGLEATIGIHVGECETHDGKIAGLAVNIGSRVASNAGAGEVLVSQTVRDLVAGSGIRFEDRGVHDLKGIPGSWQLFAVVAADT